MILYFSGTGNSRYAAEFLAQALGDQAEDVGLWIKERRKGEFRADRPWVVVAPTYGWQLPNVLMEFLQTAEFSGSQMVYFVMTCGGDIGNAAQSIQSLCRRKGLAYQGVLEVIMPENYIALFSAPEKAEAQAILRKALPTLNQGAVWIAEGKPFPEKRVTCLDRLKSGLVNRVFYQFVIRAKPFYSTEACTGCGRCVELCPLNNIHLAERHSHWGNRCTHCMACICGCPAEAVEYGRRSRGKVRYWCPEDHRA